MCLRVRVHARVSECMSVWVHECVCLFLENKSTLLSQCSHAVSANVGCFGAGKHRLRGLITKSFIALQLSVSVGQHTDVQYIEPENPNVSIRCRIDASRNILRLHLIGWQGKDPQRVVSIM